MPQLTRRTVIATGALWVLLGAGASAPAEASRFPNLAPAGDCAEPQPGRLAAPPWHPGISAESGRGITPGITGEGGPGIAPSITGESGPGITPGIPGQRGPGIAPSITDESGPGITPGIPGEGGPGIAAGRGPDAGGPGRQPVGWVASLSGSATAQGPETEIRSLTCGDPIYAGERVATDDGSSAGLLLGDVLAQLDAGSAATLGLTREATADVSLEQGAVRVIDPRPSGAPVRLAVLDVEARISGNDAEGHLGDAGRGAAMLCGWKTPLRVTRAGETAVAVSGSCVIAETRGPLRTQRAGDGRIAALGATCETAPPIQPIAHLVPLPFVAGPGPGPPLPEAPNEPLRSPCDVPGSGCGTRVVEEQPPTTDPFPGGGGFGETN